MLYKEIRLIGVNLFGISSVRSHVLEVGALGGDSTGAGQGQKGLFVT